MESGLIVINANTKQEQNIALKYTKNQFMMDSSLNVTNANTKQEQNLALKYTNNQFMMELSLTVTIANIKQPYQGIWKLTKLQNIFLVGPVYPIHWTKVSVSEVSYCT